MKRNCGTLIVIIIVTLTLASCWATSGQAEKQGANIPMNTQYIGRFSLAIPIEMQQAARSHEIRSTEIKEMAWLDPSTHKSESTAVWNEFLEKIRKLRLPEGKDRIIIKRKEFSGIGEWAEGVFYYDDYAHPSSAKWVLFVDTGSRGVWFTTISMSVEKDMISGNANGILNELGKTYRVVNPNETRLKGDWFHLEHGAINLPYQWEEKSYVRFEGHPLKLELEIEMDMDVRYKRKTTGLLDNVFASIVTGFAAGVDIKRIRSHKRVVAGLKGEEEVDRMREKDDTDLSFIWSYNGKDDSGEEPEIHISMVSPDGNLDEKLKIWDAILDSMQPMYEKKR